jgi:hypothetical protein
MTLGEQIAQDLAKKLELVNGEPVRILAQEISNRSKVNTKNGKAFGNDRYDNIYIKRYAKAFKNGQVTPVTLRNRSTAVENQVVEVSSRQGASIRFIAAGDIFKKHHDGFDYGNDSKWDEGYKERSIFPKLHESVDEDLYLELHKNVGEVLRYGR